MAFPSSTKPAHRTLTKSLLNPTPHMPYLSIPMAYNNRINSPDLYSTPSTRREFNARLSPDLGLVGGEARSLAFTNSWGSRVRSGYIFDSPRSVEAEAGFGPVSMNTSHEALTVGHDDSRYSQSHWPALTQHTQPHPATMGQYHSFTRPITRETAPIDYLERGVSRLAIGRFNTNAQTPHQLRTGSSRTGPMHRPRFQPYEPIFRARFDEYRDTEPGPATLALSPARYLTSQIRRHSGGKSEATADAENIRKLTEEEAVSRQKARRATKAAGLRKRRTVLHKDEEELCNWTQVWEGLEFLPSYERALKVALKIIENRRKPVYPEHRLLNRKSTRTVVGKVADKEYQRRVRVRRLHEKLSQYYWMDNEKEWTVPGLLLRVLDEVSNLPKPSTRPSQPSTSMAAQGV